jgi:hypothetical protein
VAEQLAPTVPRAEQEPPLPADGHICFSLLTPGGLRIASAPEYVLKNEAHPWHPLFVAMHQFLAALRLVDPSASEPAESNEEQGIPNYLSTSPANNFDQSLFFV